jgi:hypothetical protein
MKKKNAFRVMMFCLVFSFIIGLIFIYGCANMGVGKLPSVCDALEGPSVLCDMAEKTGMRIEDIGIGIAIVSTVCIREDVFSKEDALKIITSIGDSLDIGITYSIFKQLVEQNAKNYPELIIVVESYAPYFDSMLYISKADKSMIKYWIEKQKVRLISVKEG